LCLDDQRTQSPEPGEEAQPDGDAPDEAGQSFFVAGRSGPVPGDEVVILLVANPVAEPADKQAGQQHADSDDEGFATRRE
jgi:hypothetical protein